MVGDSGDEMSAFGKKAKMVMKAYIFWSVTFCRGLITGWMCFTNHLSLKNNNKSPTLKVE
jgi:hypothetical protein